MSNDKVQEPIQNIPVNLRSWLEKFAQYESTDASSEISTDKISGGGLYRASNRERETWIEHERNVYEMVKDAAKLVVATIRSTIVVIRPKQPHIYSADGFSIKPDVMISIKYNDAVCTIVVDAKNHAKYIPKKDCQKLLRDISQVEAKFGILFLNEGGRLSENLQDDMASNDVFVLQRDGYDDKPTLKETAKLFGSFIVPEFQLPNEVLRQNNHVKVSESTITIENSRSAAIRNKTTKYDITQ